MLEWENIVRNMRSNGEIAVIMNQLVPIIGIKYYNCEKNEMGVNTNKENDHGNHNRTPNLPQKREQIRK